jgi:hypothetical protein
MPSSSKPKSRFATIGAQPIRKPMRSMTAAQKKAWASAVREHHAVLRRHVKDVRKRRARKD